VIEPAIALADVTSEEYAAMFELLRTLVSHRSVDELVKDLTDRLGSGYSYVAILVYDKANDAMRIHTLRNIAPSHHPAKGFYAREDSPSLSVWESQQPQVVSNVGREQTFPALMHWFEKNGVRSFCSLPLTTARRRLGTLTLGSPNENAFERHNLAFPKIVADQVAVALENALNYEEAQGLAKELVHEKERLTLLLEINNALVSNLSLPNLISTISSNIRSAMQCDAACVSLPEPDGRTLRVRGLDFPTTIGYMKEHLVFPIEGASPGKALQTGQPVRYSFSPAYLNSAAAEVNAREGFQSGCFIPVVRDGIPLAVLHLHDRTPKKFENEEDVRFLVKIANQVAIALDNAIKYSEVSESRNQLADQTNYLSSEIRTDQNFEEILGQSSALNNVLQQVRTVSPTDSSVLIQGETGTGKELIARAIHNASRRKDHLFVKLNCAAIPLGLLESELFGHEKGAFTGAIAQKKGRFEIAHRGTLFLDEIGDIPLELQPKLLRILQEQEFERLGSTKSMQVDVRLVTATNRDLAQMVEEGRFRADLYYRLNVFPIYLPPLRERRSDIPGLVRHFVDKFGKRVGKTINEIPEKLLNSFAEYEWPGNIRELQNVVERAVILSDDGLLRSDFVASRVAAPRTIQTTNTLKDAERDHIVKALRESRWVLSGPNGAAKRLGIPRTTLIYKMRRLNIARHPETAAVERVA
jgi:formate hydrogenlyase transcriptional activator